jgi:hypothetical protein
LYISAFGGHKVNHGVLGAIGGAIVGSLAQDALKKKDKHKDEPYYDQQSQYGGSHHSGHSGHSSTLDQLGNFFKK